MSLRVFRETLYAVTFTTADVVIADCPVPQGGKQNNVFADVHWVSNESEAFDIADGTILGLEGWVIPLNDPDSGIELDALWDVFVPKDADVGANVFDIDTTGANTAQFLGYGEINLENIVGMSALPMNNQWWTSKKLMTFANSPFGHTAGTPDTWVMTDVTKIRAGKSIEADTHAWSLLAAAVPDFQDVDNTRSTVTNESSWLQFQYAELTLEQAWISLVGLTEAGAESPWEEAALSIQALVEPEILEKPGGAGDAGYSNNEMNVFCRATFDITVPGRREFNVLSGGR